MLRNAHYKQFSILIDRIIIFGRDAAAGQELDHLSKSIIPKLRISMMKLVEA